MIYSLSAIALIIIGFISLLLWTLSKKTALIQALKKVNDESEASFAMFDTAYYCVSASKKFKRECHRLYKDKSVPFGESQSRSEWDPKFLEYITSCFSKECDYVIEYGGSDLSKSVINLRFIHAKHFVLVFIEDDLTQEHLFRLGKDFVANASHELRTPITIIKGFAETLREMPEISEAMIEDVFEKVVNNCERMEGIVKNLLFLTDLDHRPSVSLQKFDLRVLVENSVHNYQLLNPQASFYIDAPESMSVVADSGLIELALSNLLQNGVKYSTQDPSITVGLQKSKTLFQIEVADRGIGVPPEKKKQIFQRFFTVDKGLSRKLGGAGLGLSIVSEVVEKHSGRINVKENPGGGTIFQLTFPIN